MNAASRLLSSKTYTLVILGVILLFSALLASTAGAQTQTIDFESLSKGEVVSSVMADGGFGPMLVNGVNADDPSINAAVIFDSDCDGRCSGSDPDLGSPNRDFNGPGQDKDNDPSMGGNAGSPFQNDRALGNILIIHEHLDEIVNGMVANPDDDANITSIVIEFPSPVTMLSFDMIDRERNEVQNVQLLGTGDVVLGTFGTPSTGDNGIATVLTDLGAAGAGTAGVMKMVMTHKGSGGLDNISFIPQPAGSGCTFTQGYWKNHVQAWPVTELLLGGVSFTQQELLDIFNTAPRGDKSRVLARQLIAAKLNVANGADPMAAFNAIAMADAWLADHGGVGSNQRLWEGGSAYKNTLDAYNNGILGPGHCQDRQYRKRKKNNRRRSAFVNNYPNPFNPTTTITFELMEASHVRLSVFDLLGRELEVLVNGAVLAGQHHATFNAGDLPSGTYLYRLVTPEGAFTQKMILTK